MVGAQTCGVKERHFGIPVEPGLNPHIARMEVPRGEGGGAPRAWGTGDRFEQVVQTCMPFSPSAPLSRRTASAKIAQSTHKNLCVALKNDMKYDTASLCVLCVHVSMRAFTCVHVYVWLVFLAVMQCEIERPHFNITDAGTR